eukprot:XP_001708364.1 Hypothetical protein GL50803_36600 [Giardia lamblia ATCC 50803]
MTLVHVFMYPEVSRGERGAAPAKVCVKSQADKDLESLQWLHVLNSFRCSLCMCGSIRKFYLRWNMLD